MDHFIDIEIRPDPEFPADQLMSALFSKLHRTLVKSDCVDIGVSFPNHDGRSPTLGNKLRLHAHAESLASFMSGDWLAGLLDHISVGTKSVVPLGASHRQIRRVQVKSSPERLRRRLMRRHAINAEAAKLQIPDAAAQRLPLPFVQLRSASTEQSFRIFIEHGPDRSDAVAGVFNSYGLSQVATVPWF